MNLKAPDVKDEHGWQVLNEQDEIAFHASSRDKARAAAKNGGFGAPERTREEVEKIAPGATTVMDVDPILKEPAVDRRSTEEIEAAAAYQVDQRIKKIVRNMKGLWLDLGAELYLFKQGRMWEKLGYESFSSYVADVDTDIEPRYAYSLAEMYEQLVIERGVDPERLKELNVSKVRTVLPAIRREQVTIEEGFSDAEALTKRDLELKYSGRASSTPGRPSTSSKVETDNEPVWARCPTCGSRYQADPQTGQRIET
jgi:hypothetical protein